MYRSRKVTLAYKPRETLKSLKEGRVECPFCVVDAKQVVKKYQGFVILKNLFSYQYWEYMDVIEHLMIVPKRHVDTIAELKPTEKQELIDIMSEWEAKGYNIYMREKDSAMKSVPHQHTHLIKTRNRTAKFALFIDRPYFVIKK